MKPKTWQELPPAILERLLENVDLQYDNYESSRAEKIYELLNYSYNCVSERNSKEIQSMLDAISEERFQKYCEQVVENLENTLDSVKPFLK